jgi:hypothetical protein
MTDLTNALAEGHEETQNQEFITEIDGLFDQESHSSLCKKLLSKIDPTTSPSNIRKIVKSWIYFELFTSHNLSEKTKTVFDVLCDISLRKFQYQEGERDLVIMHHIFTI